MANGSTQLALVGAYVPAIVARDVGRAGAAGPPRSRPLRAAVLLVDISGFTAVAEQLCQRGPAGIEELSTTINSCFGRILDVIAAHGGEVLRFAGDALIVLWEVEVGDSAALAEASLRASACGLELRPVLADSATAYGHALALRIGVSAGDLLALHVGGEVAGGQRDLVVGGPAIVEMGEAERRAAPGQVVVAPSLHGPARGRLQGTALDGGYFVVDALHEPPVARPAPAVTSDGAHLATLGGYLPAGLLDRLSGAGSAWQAELRRVSVLFLHLPEVDFGAAGVADLVHGAFVATQRVVIQAGGTINQFVIDDKGAVMVIAWGLPASAHEDDPLRAVRAALGITKALRALGLGASIGVTTGRVYCGDRGNGARREYALIGDAVNVAARLMGASRGTVLCDDATMQACGGRVQFHALAPLTLKGKSAPLAVHQATGAAAQARGPTEVVMVGRAVEAAALTASVRRLAAGEAAGVVVIRGSAGMGKSVLLQAARGAARAEGVTTWSSEGDAVEAATPYYAWRGLLVAAFGPGPLDAVELASHLGLDSPLLPLLPLLGLVLPVGLPNTDATLSLDAPSRADAVQSLVTAIVANAAKAGPLALLIEDAHWLDSASWEVLRRVQREVPGVLLVLATRPMDTPPSRAQVELLSGESTTWIELGPLDRGATEQLVCERLGVARVSPEVSAFLFARAEGHPFFTEQLARALRDDGLARVESDVFRLSPGADIDSLAFPATLEGVITSRVDRLTPRSQLALKVASVVGRVFAGSAVHAVLPAEAEQVTASEVEAILSTIAATELIRPGGDDGALERDLWTFTHAIAQDVVYNLMLSGHRRLLHLAIGEWIERHTANDVRKPHAVLARHFLLGGAPARAAEHLESAGQLAAESSSHTEATRFYGELVELAPRLPALAPLRRAGWERSLAAALLGNGHLAKARAHVAQAFALAGSPWPSSAARIARALLTQVARQAALRLLPAFMRPAAVGREAVITDACLVVVTLAYMDNRADELMLANLMALNAADIANDDANRAACYAFLSIACGGLGLHPLAEFYERRAIAEAGPDERLQLRVIGSRALYRIGRGDYDLAEELGAKSMDAALRLNDRRGWELACTTQGYVYQVHGEFERGLELYRQVHLSGLRRHDVQLTGWGLNGMAMCLLPLGRFDEAITCLEASRPLITDELSRLACLGFEALALLRSGQVARARQLATATADGLATSSLASFATYKDYAAVAEVLAYLVETDADGPAGRPALLAKLSATCTAMRRRSWVYPIGAAAAWLWTGRLHALQGSLPRARSSLAKAVAAAVKSRSPYEQGLAEIELGRIAAGPDRAAHLRAAIALLTPLHASWDLARAAQLLEPPTEPHAPA